MRYLAWLLLTTCVSVPSQRTPASDYRLNFPRFVELLKTKKVETVAEAIQALRPRYDDHLQFRTAMYVSESIQQATFSEPRVLVFGRDARFVFSFNGGRHNYGGDAIEAYQFDDIEKKFEFYSIVFKKESEALAFDQEEIAFEDQRLVITKANPSLCVGCHGTPALPIWSDDLNWAGAYGSNDDLLYGSFHRANYVGHGNYDYLGKLTYPRSQGRWFDLATGVPDLELSGYLSYIKGASGHDRYKHLPPQPFEAGFRKFVAGKNEDESATIQAANEMFAVVKPDSIDRPNLLFTDRVAGLAAEVLLAEIAKRPALKRMLLDAVVKTQLKYGYFGAGREKLFKGEELIKSLDKETRDYLRRKAGPFSEYFRTVLLEELEMQVVRFKRIEDDLRSPVYVPAGWASADGLTDETRGGYEKLLGRKMDRLEIISAQGEAAGLPLLAVFGYIMKAEGLDLRAYNTNSHLFPRSGRQRVINNFEGLSKIVAGLKATGR